MRSLKRTCLSVLAFVFLSSVSAEIASPQTGHTAIRAARLIDGKSETVVNNAVVLVENDKITAVGSGLQIPGDAKVIDLGDATLLPGFIDAHTHLLSEMDGTNLTLQDVEMLRIVATQSTARRALLGAKLGREDLEAGITTVRDLGNSGVNGDVALRDAINHGWLPGPRIVAATRALAAQGGQFGQLAPEAQSIIESNRHAGSRQIGGHCRCPRRSFERREGFGARQVRNEGRRSREKRKIVRAGLCSRDVRASSVSAKLVQLLPSRERWPSGLRRTLGKRV